MKETVYNHIHKHALHYELCSDAYKCAMCETELVSLRSQQMLYKYPRFNTRTDCKLIVSEMKDRSVSCIKKNN